MSYEYNKYLKKINEMLKSDPFYKEALEGINSGDSDFRIVQKINKKVFDLEWVDFIEEVLPSLDEIVRNPRKFIVVEEDIIDISLAKSISVESVRHLAQHTNFIANVDGDDVTPSRILNTSKEESYEVYENRFIYTLLKKLSQFINTRYDAISKTINDSDQIQILIESDYKVGNAPLSFKLDSIAKMSFDEAMELNKEGLTPVERVVRMRQIVNGFMSSAFAKSMVSSALVRPPITRTNVIKKNPAYKKALELWGFIETYDKKGFDISPTFETKKMDDKLAKDYQGLMFLNTMILKNLSNDKGFDNKQTSIVSKLDDYPLISLDIKDIKYLGSDSNDNQISKDLHKRISDALNRCLIQNELNVHLSKELKLEQENIEKLVKDEYEQNLIDTSLENNKIDNFEWVREKERIEKLVLDKLEEEKKELFEKIVKELEHEEAMSLLRKANLILASNRNILKSFEIARIEEMRRNYKIECLKLVDKHFDELMKIILEVDVNKLYEEE